MPSFTDEMNRRLRNMTILSGGHEGSQKKFCIMEAVSYIAGQPHSAQPVCVSDTISDFLIGINDSRENDKERNKLKKVVPDIMGTRPTKSTKSRFEVAGQMVDGTLEVPKETKGYIKAEERRAKLLEKELAEFGSESDVDYVPYNSIPTKAAIEIARKMAKVKNKA